LGGGVSDYPTGENILCGIDSYEICQASFPLNTQVTLNAYQNEGYEFSHWEINDLAMADVDGSIDVTMSENKNVKAVFVPVLGFPLNGYTSTTVPISAVMDHSLSSGFYTTDGRNNEVEAFNGLIANGTQHSYNGNVYCYDTTNTNPFPGLNYVYTYPLENRSEICYDEHPGFDFAVVNGTNVLAPFAGRLYQATTDLINGNPGTFGTFYIDHENGYTSWFLHCSGLTQSVLDQIQQKGYADVSKGDHIAESGNEGPEGTPYHLHFEVRKDGVDDEHVIDPYGWELWEE
jgi:murein DD-endopeptidase MepM/ murein hydrolase activator NlpD